MKSHVTDHFAVITGAAKGIGYELAKELARRGYALLICADDHAIVRAASELGDTVVPLQVDLASFEGIEKLYTRLKTMPRPLDVACINASVGRSGAFVESDLHDDLNLINANVTSAVHLAKRVAVDMVHRGVGRILLSSSGDAHVPRQPNAIDHAAKAFIYAFSEAIRDELAGTGVTVTALVPGSGDTNITDVARQGIDALLAGKDHVVAGSFEVHDAPPMAP